MKFSLVPMLVTACFCLHATSEPEANKLLNAIRHNTDPAVIPLKTLPQNFGGQDKKMLLNNSKNLEKKIKELALSDEAVFQDVIKDIFLPLQSMIENRKADFSQLAQKDTKFTFKNLDSENKKVFDGISQITWTLDNKTANLEQFEPSFKTYLNEFSKVEYTSVTPYSTSTPISDRNVKTSQPELYNVDVRFDIRGIDNKKFRRNDRFTAKMIVSKGMSSKTWKISDFSLELGETLTAEKSFFTEKNMFSAEAPSNYLRKEAIRRGGYAISMGDWNNDGLPDLIVGQMGKVEFFSGQKDQTFQKIDNSKLGILDDTLVKSAVVNDFDNDGIKDILIVRFAPGEQIGKDIVIYKGLGAAAKTPFQKLTSIKNRYPAYYAMPSAIGDYNNDGLLDFYIGFPGAKDFTVLNKKAHGFKGLKELHPQGLFYNIGGFEFQEVTKEKMTYNKKHNAYTDGYPELSAIFPHTSLGVDYDLDGHVDIVVIDDKANLSPLYKNRGDGTFIQNADKIGLLNSDFGMGFTAADLDNDGKLEFIYSNVNFAASERIGNSWARNFSEYSKMPGAIGIKIFKTLDGKNYSDITSLTGITNVGEGVGGVEVVDYNNDGYMDLYVTNGLWSGNNREQDLSSRFARAYSKYDYDFQETLGSAPGVEEANTNFMKILTGFEGLIESGKPQKNVHPSMAGFQRNRLFRNNGDGTFTEIGYLAGVDSIADGYVVATADLNNDGKTDLVLRNADPGVDANRFPAVQMYINNFMAEKRNSVTLAFSGSKSNLDAIGIIAIAQVGDKKITRHLTANNGSVQSQPILHFGLGNSDKIDQLTVRWPSGLQETFKNIPAGFHLLKEGTPYDKTAGL